ncbi:MULTISPECIES: helix-turn-helix domain-containing protein [Enterococcus]|uniref:helix-turn-helix domain-containing protein n=1 Tax=Enterococcus TaxID=1350 RepID=UPI0002FE0035|nr:MULTISPECIES: helix-turn-helix domain-containing protein [Enterococcus]MDO0895852.1 helix-turn-helix domain-containing protein [Enterococcus sp. B1E4]MDO0908640.1 helix-turn-helix domain-containing protein [Enterococcus sp. B2E4]
MLENLSINLHRDKAFSRQVKILQVLNAAPTGYHPQELATLLGLSLPTVTKELSILSDSLPKELVKITLSETNIVSIAYAPNASINSAIQYLGMETLEFKIMTSIIDNKKYSIHRATIEFGYSRSHLLRTISYMNKSLQTYSVTIATNHLDFIGTEADIRFCLFVFFSAYGDSTILDKDSPADARLLVQKAKEANTKDLHYSHYRLALWLSIAKRRWRYSYFLTLPPSLERNLLEKERFAIFSEILNEYYLKKYRIIHLPQQELLWIFVNALHCLSYSTMDINGESDADYIFHHTERPEIIAEAAAFLEKSGVAIPPAAAHKIIAYLVNLRLLTMISANYEFADPQIKAFVETTFKTDYLSWNEWLKPFNDQSRFFSFTHLEHIAVTLTLLSELAPNPQLKKHLKVAFAFQGGAGLDAFLAASTELFKNDHTEISYFFEVAPDEQELIHREIDLIVSNFDLHLKSNTKFQQLRISNVPTLSDWTIIHKTIEELIQPRITPIR